MTPDPRPGPPGQPSPRGGTAEVVDTIANGIRVPAQKIAVMVTQAKYVAEGLLEKVKSMGAKSPFGSRTRPE